MPSGKGGRLLFGNLADLIEADDKRRGCHWALPFSDDEILDTVMLYWLPAAGASSARLYSESMADASLSETIDLPVGVTIPPRDTMRAPRAWAERYLCKLIHWNEPTHGGHFIAFEQPAIFVDEVRTCFRAVR